MTVHIAFALCPDGVIHAFRDEAARPMCGAAVIATNWSPDEDTPLCDGCDGELLEIALTLPGNRRLRVNRYRTGRARRTHGLPRRPH